MVAQRQRVLSLSCVADFGVLSVRLAPNFRAKPEFPVSLSPRPNCCKRLTKRRLFARAALAALERSALGGGAVLAQPISKRRENRAAVSVAVFSRFAIYANVVSRTMNASVCAIVDS